MEASRAGRGRRRARPPGPGRGTGAPFTVGVFEGRRQQVILAAEVPIDGARRQSRRLSDQGHRRAVIASVGRDLQGGVEMG